MKFHIAIFCLIVNGLTIAAPAPPPLPRPPPPPPGYLFWASSTSPDQIFQNGRPPRGENDNLQQYALGTSCRANAASRTFFSEASENHDRVWSLANGLSSRMPNQNVYLYVFRATPRWHRLGLSLREAYPEQVGLAQQLADRYANEAIWIHPGTVPANTIVAAYRIQDRIYKERYWNANYSWQQPQLMGSIPYIPRNTTFNEHLLMEYAIPDFDYMPACQADAACHNTQAQWLSATPPTACSSLTFESAPLAQFFARQWLPILFNAE